MGCSYGECGQTSVEASSTGTKNQESSSDDCYQSLTEEIFMI